MFKRAMNKFSTLIRKKNGQAFGEYGGLIAVILLIVIVGAIAFGNKLLGIFNNVTTSI